MGCLGGKCRAISPRPNILNGITRINGLEGYCSVVCTIAENDTHELFLTSDGEFFVLSDGLIFKVLKDERI